MMEAESVCEPLRCKLWLASVWMLTTLGQGGVRKQTEPEVFWEAEAGSTAPLLAPSLDPSLCLGSLGNWLPESHTCSFVWPQLLESVSIHQAGREFSELFLQSDVMA